MEKIIYDSITKFNAIKHYRPVKPSKVILNCGFAVMLKTDIPMISTYTLEQAVSSTSINSLRLGKRVVRQLGSTINDNVLISFYRMCILIHRWVSAVIIAQI